MTNTPYSFTDQDTRFMQRAIELAKRGWGQVSPNPPVGCVIVSPDGQIVGEGWHQKYGTPHAEPSALADAGDKANGATAYVTLMPCNHHGKTPPCTQALIRAGIKAVIVAVDDPNPEASGGRVTLEEAGIEVRCGLLEKESSRVLGGFLKYIRHGLPQLTLKYAMTLDGKIATASGDSKWISCEASRAIVQQLRAEHDAIMVGSGTALADDPRLNVRDESRPQPLRIVIDSKLRTSPDCNLLHTHGGKVILLTHPDADADAEEKLLTAGAAVHRIPSSTDHVDLPGALHLLGEVYGIRRIFCEGGGGLSGALIRAKLIDCIKTFIAPKVLGGSGITPTEGGSIAKMAEALPLEDMTCEPIETDLLLTTWVGA